MSRGCVIYKITNICTSQIYIGSSIRIKARISRHFRDLKLGKHHSLKMQRSYNKYGRECFIVEFMLTIPEDYRKKIEQWFLDNNECYFNNEKVVGAPSKDREFTEEQKESARKRLIGNTYWKLRQPTNEEQRAFLADLARNRVWKDESKEKLSISKMGNSSRSGLPHIDKTKKIMSDNSTNKREISQFTLSGDLVKEWESIAMVVKELNVDNSSIVLCCQEKRKSAHEFMWRYKEEVPESKKLEPLKGFIKYDHNAVMTFYNSGKSRKETMAEFNITSSGLMHYIISKYKKI